MKKSLAFLMAFSLICNFAYAVEIATVMGKPGEKLDFTDQLIQERIELGGPKAGEVFTTWTYSILARKGVRSAVSVEVVNDQGSLTTTDFIKAIQIAASKAPVVFTHVGPIENEICSVLSEYKDTAFIIVAGNSARKLDPNAQPKCLGKNILRVTALNQYKGEVPSFANYGDTLVRIAAPSIDILSRGLDGKERKVSNTTVGASLVSARLAIFARENPTLKGANLIDDFLRTNTKILPKLFGKVEGGRVLNDSL